MLGINSSHLDTASCWIYLYFFFEETIFQCEQENQIELEKIDLNSMNEVKNNLASWKYSFRI